MQELLEQLAMTSGWELTAVLSAIIYLVLAARQSQWCWAAAIISCAIYVGLMLSARVYYQVALNVIYVILAIYGWWSWHRLAQQPQTATEAPPLSWHVAWLAPLIMLSGVLGWLLDTYSDGEQVWLDSLLLVFSLFATYLLTRKWYATWWYWLVIDSIYVVFFAQQQLLVTALLYVIYVLLVLYAMWQWRQQVKVS